MKKIITMVLGTAVCLGAAAQSWQDAYLFSESHYGGTARSVGMGNAITAIGGDLGSIGLNPAGSAVAGYSQITLTPSVSISSVRSSGDMTGNTGFAAFQMPNAGAIFKLDIARRRGLKRVSFGFVVNSTNDFTRRGEAFGVNSNTSYAASLASGAEGYTADQLAKSDWYAQGTPVWVDRVGYLSGMYNGIPGHPGLYQAITEDRSVDGDRVNRWLTAPLDQRYGEQYAGGKYDGVLNIGFNFSDKFYLGANVGFSWLNYNMSEYWFEKPNDDSEFAPITYDTGEKASFVSLRMKRSYSLRATGVYFKIGALWRPVAGLRLGAAIQTPTSMLFRARNAYQGEVTLSGKSISPYTSPEDEWSYVLRTPFRANLGVAYSFGSIAVISADYELADYRQARYSVRNDFMPDYLNDANLDIRDALGISHQLRLGVEVKPLPALALRAGGNFTTTGQRNFLDYYTDAQGKVQVELTPLTPKERLSQSQISASLGAGYSFAHFFVDASFRSRFQPAEYVTPYVYYTYDGSDYANKYEDTSVTVPEIRFKPILFDVLLTLGWRF